MRDFAFAWDRSLQRTQFFQPDGPAHTHRTIHGSFADPDVEVAGNWRADNAAALIAELGLERSTSLARLLAEAWRNWGKDLARKLHGPFAIAVYDKGKSELFAARDALGLEPFYIAQNAQKLAVASSPRKARAACGLPSTPNEEMIAAFLRSHPLSATATFHEGLERIAPGHFIVCDAAADGRQVRYYDLADTPMIDPSGDPVAQFRRLFDDEIARCGGTAEGVAVQLSGGLDSSAIAGSINQLHTNPETVATLSMTFANDPSWSDGPYLDAMRAACSMQHHSIDSSDRDPLAQMSAAIEALDGPSLAVGISANLALFDRARSLGLTTLFNGHGGDEVVSWGAGRLNELASKGRWIKLWHESRGVALVTNTTRWRVFDRHLLRIPAWRTLRRLFWTARNALRPSHPVESDEADGSLLSADLNSAYPTKTQNDGRFATIDWTERDQQERILKDPLQPHSLETLTLTARHFGIDLAMPFYGRDLVEYSLSLPSEWKLRGGQTRYVLSAAMSGRIPEKIANRKTKHNFGPSFVRNIVKSDQIHALTRHPSKALLRYVNADKLHSIWAKVEQDIDRVTIHDARALWMIAVLALWLDSDRDACLRA